MVARIRTGMRVNMFIVYNCTCENTFAVNSGIGDYLKHVSDASF